MDLIRKILFAIEDKINNVAEYNLEIEGYSMEQVAYHCSIMYDAGLLHDYKGLDGDGEIYSFGVGRLTWEGHEFLDKIRSDTTWNKTKDTIIKNGLPMVLDVMKNVATSIVTVATEVAIRG